MSLLIIRRGIIQKESDHYHSRLHFVQGLGSADRLDVVGQFGTVVLQNVGQSEAELDFRIKLEIREIEVATYTDGQIGVGCLEFQIFVAFLAHVECSHSTHGDVRTGVMVSVAAYFQVQRQRHVHALHILAQTFLGSRRHEFHGFRSEGHAGPKTEIEMLGQTQVGEHRHIYAGTPRGNGRVPFVAVGSRQSVVREHQILH